MADYKDTYIEHLTRTEAFGFHVQHGGHANAVNASSRKHTSFVAHGGERGKRFIQKLLQPTLADSQAIQAVFTTPACLNIGRMANISSSCFYKSLKMQVSNHSFLQPSIQSNMKFITKIIFIILLAWVAEIYLPWWSIAAAAAVGGFLLKSKANFLAGFLAIAVLWLVKALLIDMSAAVPLADKVSKVLLVNSKALLMLVTALLGGLVGGFGALTGSLLRGK